MRVVIFIPGFKFFFFFFKFKKRKKASKKNLFANFYIIKKESFFFHYYYHLSPQGFSRRARMSKLLTFNFYFCAKKIKVLIDEYRNNKENSTFQHINLQNKPAATFFSKPIFEMQSNNYFRVWEISNILWKKKKMIVSFCTETQKMLEISHTRK